MRKKLSIEGEYEFENNFSYSNAIRFTSDLLPKMPLLWVLIILIHHHIMIFYSIKSNIFLYIIIDIHLIQNVLSFKIK